jgi:hypothetical protein
MPAGNYTDIHCNRRDIIISPGHVVCLIRTIRSPLELTTAGGQQCSFRQLTDSTWHEWATVNLLGTSRSWNSAQNLISVFCHVFRLRQNFAVDFVYTSFVIVFLNLPHLGETPYLYLESRLKTIENNKSSKRNRENQSNDQSLRHAISGRWVMSHWGHEPETRQCATCDATRSTLLPLFADEGYCPP